MNETGFAPAPVLPPTPPKSDYHLKLLIVATLGVIAACVIFFLVRSMNGLPLVSSSPVANGTRVEFADASGAAWYQVVGGNLQAASGPVGYEELPFTVKEIAGALPNGDRSVLVEVKGQKGTVLGVLRADDSFAPVLADGTSKEGLAVRPDGLAMFSIPVPAPQPVVAKGTPPPVVIDASSPLLPAWQIELVHLSGTDHKSKSLGEGRVIGQAGDGEVVAVASTGVVTVDPLTGVRHTVISTGAPALAGVISYGDATMIAIVNPLTMAIDVYTASSLQVAGAAYAYSIPGPTTTLALVGQDLFARSADGTATVYSFANDPAHRLGTLGSASQK